MFESGQNWELFGYDMRNLGKHLRAAWRDLLWTYDSPVRAHLDEPVMLHSLSGSACYQAGEPIGDTKTDCRAVLLPDELVLSRSLRLPVAVEADLESVLALEVNSNSPFAAADTGFGWTLVARDEQYLHLVLLADIGHGCTERNNHQHQMQILLVSCHQRPTKTRIGGCKGTV